MFAASGLKPTSSYLEWDVGGKGSSSVDAKGRFVIRWREFQSNVLGTLEELHRAQDFSDVVLSSEDGVRIRAHRLVLASGSGYFRQALLDASPACCCQLPVVVLSGVDGPVLKAIVHYLYFGEVNVASDILAPFIDAAKKLCLKGMSGVELGKEQRDVDLGLSMVYESPADVTASLPPLVPCDNLDRQQSTPPAQRSSDGLSILAQAASKADERFAAYPMLHHQLALAAPPPRRRPVSESTNCSVFSTMSAESDDNNPMNCAMNLSIKNEPSPDALTVPSYGCVPFSLPENNSFSHRQHAVPDGFRFAAADLPSSPTALDMSAHSKTDFPCHGKASPFDFCDDGAVDRREGLTPPALRQQVSIMQADKALTSLTTNTRKDEPRKPAKKRKRSALSETAIDGATAAVSVNNENDEGEVAPVSSSSGPHTNDKNWKSRQPMGCEICERTFSNKFNLKQHVLNMHTPGRTVFCELCHKKVKNKWYLRRHKVTHHNAPLKK